MIIYLLFRDQLQLINCLYRVTYVLSQSFTSLRRFTLFPLHTPSSPSHYAPEGRGYGNEGMSDVAERAVGRAVGSETRTRNRMRREGVERWVRGRRMPCESSVG